MLKLKDILWEVKKLRVFDFDDTLATSNSRVKVNHADGTSTMMTPGEYAVYEKRDGDTFDYSEFKEVIDPKEIKAMTKVLRNFYKANGERRITILTARGVVAPIQNFMKKIGINNIEVVALDDSDPQKKADWIEQKVKEEGYDDVFFVDDSLKNVEAVKKRLKSYPKVKQKIQHIKHS